MLMKSIGGTDVVGLRRCLEVTRQRRRRFARAFIDLHAHAGVLTHGVSKKVSSLRCNLDVVLVDERELWAPAKTGTGGFYKDHDVISIFFRGVFVRLLM